MPQILGNLKGTAWTPPKQWCNPSFRHVIKLPLTQKLLSRVYVSNRPRLYPVHETKLLSYAVKMQRSPARTQLCWYKHMEVLLGMEGATCERCATISQGACRKAHGARVLPQCRIALFSSNLPTPHCFKLCFSPFVLTKCNKEWFSRSGRCWKGASVLVPASSCFRTASHCIFLSFPNDANICKIFCDRFSHSAPLCNC